MNLDHFYTVSVEWQGNRGTGTLSYKSYGREHLITAQGKPDIAGSADRAFFGDPERWNPEETLLAALTQCHMLSYLHVAAMNGVVVEAYTDAATGSIRQTDDGGGAFVEATLRPIVTISAGSPALALGLHREANRECFIASSVNFPVHHEPRILLLDDARS